MKGCHTGKLFQVSVAGGSYQDGLTTMIHGVPPGLKITEAELYKELLLRKPGADPLSSPRKEPDLPVIYSGVNAADTIEGAGNKGNANGTPLTILIPNLDRHFEHIEQYQDTNRTPRPGHCSFASHEKYGPNDDAIGAGFFSGRYTATIVAAGAVAKKILARKGIDVFAYVQEIAGISAGDTDHETAKKVRDSYQQMRVDYDPFFTEVYKNGRITEEMRFLEKMTVLAQIEKEIKQIRATQPKFVEAWIREKYGVHHVLNCPNLQAADAMFKRAIEIYGQDDSSGGVVEVVATGLPPGLGEPVFDKLDAAIGGGMMGIGAVKAVEIGAGIGVKDMLGSENNDEMYSEGGQVKFKSNNAGGVTGGLTTGQPLVARLIVKPTPTIAKGQATIDKYSLENKVLGATTRRDPTIVARIWPVAESMLAIILVDYYMQQKATEALM